MESEKRIEMELITVMVKSRNMEAGMLVGMVWLELILYSTSVSHIIDTLL